MSRPTPRAVERTPDPGRNSAPIEGSVVTLGGRALRVIAGGSARHEYWLAAQLRDAGIAGATLARGETADQFVERLLDALLASQSALLLLSGLLAPPELDREDWTPHVAAAVREHLERLCSDDDKTVLRGLVAHMVAGFLRSGFATVWTREPSGTLPRDPLHSSNRRG